MARNTSVSLGEHFSKFIDTQVQTGRFNSASDVIRASLRILEDHETKIKALQSALIEGEISGESTHIDRHDFLSEMHQKHVR